MLVTQLYPTLCNLMDCMQPARLLCPWNSPGKNTRVGSHSLLQGIFQTQGSNPGLLHCKQILYCLSHQGISIYILNIVPEITPWRTRGQSSRWTWGTSLSTDTSGIHLQTQNCMQNTSLEQTGGPDQWKRIYRTTQNQAGGRNQGEKQECQQNWTCPRRVEELKQGSDPQSSCLSQRRNI